LNSDDLNELNTHSMYLLNILTRYFKSEVFLKKPKKNNNNNNEIAVIYMWW